MNEPTAWEDINPQTDLAKQQEPRSRSLDPLEPASTEDFRNELTACLALVVPVGMTEEARRDWLAVAWATVGHLPTELLRIGCYAARQKCDHPAKIVPAILEATKQQMDWRRSYAREVQDCPRLEKPSYITPSEASSILREYGLRK